MKLRAILGIALAPTVLLGGCDNIFGLDNYDEPDSMLSGRVVYNGQPVNLRSNGVELELWQLGYEQPEKIPVYISQEGLYSAALFAGDYKLNAIRGQGPWVIVPNDTLQIAVSGETTRDFPVTPYYFVSNPSFNYVAASGAGADTVGNISATFNVNTVVPDTDPAYRAIQSVELYVGTTAFIDQTNRLVQVVVNEVDLPATWETAPMTLSVSLPPKIRLTPSPAPRTHVQARIGIKIAGVAERIFSPVVEVPIPATP